MANKYEIEWKSQVILGWWQICRVNSLQVADCPSKEIWCYIYQHSHKSWADCAHKHFEITILGGAFEITEIYFNSNDYCSYKIEMTELI